jgi:DNA-directed RNA polymerase specialized sigma24 family protein
MTQDRSFPDLIRRVRAGEQAAATELVRRFEPEIHKAIRVLLVNFQLNRILDIGDISQAVLATFFARAAAGEFLVNDPEQLLKLLLTMARNKVRDEARKYQAQRRDRRRVQEKITEECMEMIAASEPTPSKIVAGHELLAEFYRRLSAEERWLADQRTQGKDWAAIAAQVGSSADALRKKLARACSRVARQLGLPDMSLC